jgi:2-hydroxy-4-carboxymuconate semialdehyde hemiacetal dehydrogenase
MRICFIGTGSIAEDHIDAFKKLGGVEFDTVVSRLQASAETFAAAHGFSHATTDVDEALENGSFDAALICSPSNLHAVQAEKALQADKHALVEIPIATKYSDAERIARLADREGKILMVAHTQRFFQPLIEAKRKIDDGSFHLHHFVASWFFLRRRNVNWKGKQRSWTDNLLWHHACHVVDVALWLLGAENVDVSGMLARPSESLHIPLDLNISMRTEQGQLATISMSYNSPWSLHEYVLIGEEDTLIYRNQRLENQGGVLTERQENPMLLQDGEFLAAVRENRPASVNAWTVSPTMRVLQSVQNQNPHTPSAEAVK